MNYVRSANEIAAEAERRERAAVEPDGRPQPWAPPATRPDPRKGRVIGVYDHGKNQFLHGHEPGEDLITEEGTVQPYGEHYLIVDDDEHRFFVNLQKYRFVEFLVREDEGE